MRPQGAQPLWRRRSRVASAPAEDLQPASSGPRSSSQARGQAHLVSYESRVLSPRGCSSIVQLRIKCLEANMNNVPEIAERAVWQAQLDDLLVREKAPHPRR